MTGEVFGTERTMIPFVSRNGLTTYHVPAVTMTSSPSCAAATARSMFVAAVAQFVKGAWLEPDGET